MRNSDRICAGSQCTWSSTVGDAKEEAAGEKSMLYDGVSTGAIVVAAAGGMMK
jgi:hypothetical protein